jgi:hypothetical protein
MGFQSDLRALVQAMPAPAGPGASPASNSSHASNFAEETGMMHSAMQEQKMQQRKLQLQTRGLSDTGAEKVASGQTPSSSADVLKVSNALGKPPAAAAPPPAALG